MNKETLEHLSSLMDGELSRETGLFLTRRLSSDASLGQVWRRYHLIRDCMRRPGERAPVVDFAHQVQRALAVEPQQPVETIARRWFKPLAGVAVAATVCFMAILAVGPGQRGGADPAVDTVSASPFTSPNGLNPAPVTQAASFNPEELARSARLNAYLLRHNQFARSSGRQGFVSFVPLISANSDEGSESTDTERGDDGNGDARRESP